MQLVYHLDNHVYMRISIASDVFCHRTIFSPPVSDVKTMVVEPAM